MLVFSARLSQLLLFFEDVATGLIVSALKFAAGMLVSMVWHVKDVLSTLPYKT